MNCVFCVIRDANDVESIYSPPSPYPREPEESPPSPSGPKRFFYWHPKISILTTKAISLSILLLQGRKLKSERQLSPYKNRNVR